MVVKSRGNTYFFQRIYILPHARLLHGELAGLERTIYPQLQRIADTVSRSALDRLRDFKTDVKAVSQRIGRVRRVSTSQAHSQRDALP